MLFRFKAQNCSNIEDYSSNIKEIKELAPGACSFQYEGDNNSIIFDAPSTYYRALLGYNCEKLDRLHK